MKVKVFPLAQEQEANEFIQSHVLLDEGAVHITGEGIVVFYQSTKEEYGEYFRLQMIDNLKRNLLHEQIRQAANDAEYESMKVEGRSTYPEFDEAGKKQKEIVQNIKNFEAKIAALESWTADNTSKTSQ